MINISSMENLFNLRLLKNNDNKGLEDFNNGSLDDIQIGNRNFYDDAITYAIDKGFYGKHVFKISRSQAIPQRTNDSFSYFSFINENEK